jgi:hypothetical protein
VDLEELQQLYGVISDIESGQVPDQDSYRLISIDKPETFFSDTLEAYTSLLEEYTDSLSDTVEEKFKNEDYEWLRQLLEKVIKIKKALHPQAGGEIIQLELF